MKSLKVKGKYDSCCITFATNLEHLDFENNLSVYFAEGHRFRINIYEKFAEVEMGETFVHSSVGQELGVILHVHILEALYRPGTRIFDTGIYLGGSGGTSPPLPCYLAYL